MDNFMLLDEAVLSEGEKRKILLGLQVFIAETVHKDFTDPRDREACRLSVPVAVLTLPLRG